METPVKPTEVQERVETAIQAFFSGDLERTEGKLRLSSDNVNAFRQRVWDERIIDTMRGQMLHGCDGKSTRFYLSKQGAASDRLAIPVGKHALGDLTVTLRVEDDDPWDDAEALCWWVCPETEEGEIIGPTD